ncbi:hypothetical protein ACFLRZ_02930 [Bacteroidota bacterium]
MKRIFHLTILFLIITMLSCCASSHNMKKKKKKKCGDCPAFSLIIISEENETV